MKIRIGLLMALGALPLLLTACGGGGANAGASSSSSTTTGGSSGTSNRARDTSAFRKCLSDHGVTLPSGNFGGPPGGGDGANGSPPNPGANGGPPQGGFPGGNNPKFQEAMNACRSKLPSGRRGGFGRNSQAFQAYTSCLKDHGVTVPSGGSGATGGSGSASPGALRNLQSDPKFIAANKTCQALLPARNGGNGPTSTTVGT